MDQSIPKNGRRVQTALTKKADSTLAERVVYDIRYAIKHKFLLLLIIPGFLYLLVFCYQPMYGLILAIKDFDPNLGILGSPWISPWYRNFVRFFGIGGAMSALYNTLFISMLKLITGFPAPILFALLLNELGSNRYKRVIQTISYLPYFLSWIVVASLMFTILSPSMGLVGYIYHVFYPGVQAPLLLQDPNAIIPILLISEIWKGVGYGSVIYLAALSGVPVELYEAAFIDGAGAYKRAVHITIPSIIPVLTIMVILSFGGILNAGFDQIFNLSNPITQSKIEILDTLMFRVGMGSAQYEFATALGFMKNIASFMMVYLANAIVKKFSEYSLM